MGTQQINIFVFDQAKIHMTYDDDAWWKSNYNNETFFVVHDLTMV